MLPERGWGPAVNAPCLRQRARVTPAYQPGMAASRLFDHTIEHKGSPYVVSRGCVPFRSHYMKLGHSEAGIKRSCAAQVSVRLAWASL